MKGLSLPYYVKNGKKKIMTNINAMKFLHFFNYTTKEKLLDIHRSKQDGLWRERQNINTGGEGLNTSNKK